MVPNSAYFIVEVKEGVDYKPQTLEGKSKESPIYALHCTKTNEEPIELIPLGGEDKITYPPRSFRQGVVYHIYLKQIVKLGGAEFKGHKYHTAPVVL